MDSTFTFNVLHKHKLILECHIWRFLFCWFSFHQWCMKHLWLTWVHKVNQIYLESGSHVSLTFLHQSVLNCALFKHTCGTVCSVRAERMIQQLMCYRTVFMTVLEQWQVVPMRSPQCPCERTGGLAGTGPWPGSQTPPWCETLWRQNSVCK